MKIMFSSPKGIAKPVPRATSAKQNGLHTHTAITINHCNNNEYETNFEIDITLLLSFTPYSSDSYVIQSHHPQNDNALVCLSTHS